MSTDQWVGFAIVTGGLEHMKQSKKVLIAVVAVLVLLGAFRIISANRSTVEEEKYQVNVKTSQVTSMDLATTSPLTGSIQAEDQVVLAAALQAEVTGVYVEVGDYVTAGTTLVTLDTSSVSGSYGQASAAYNMAVEGLNTAKTNYERMKTLYAEGAISQQALEQAQTAYTTAQEQVNQASAALGSAGSAVGYGTITSPIDGYVTDLNAVVGQFPGTPVAAISDTSTLEISTNVSEYLVPEIKVGDAVTISVKSLPDQTFTGTIKTIAPAPGVGTFTYPVTISVDAGQEGLMAGMFAEVHVTSSRKDNVLAVPSDAVLIKNGDTQVVVLNDNIPEFVSVQTGLDNGEYVEILSGLTEGQTIVTTGQHYVVAGEEVNVVE